ncbi:MAG: UDP-3-O-(3-hydroxymyristoyl)glucosamine N-acyltransferase [Deltaproteobacteria bacterium]|nr:UDP-3-O-(3-hydroxymyristoyl)glucosamine N-acyltransferase [Deltaproteobacteria bacterium]
MRLADIAQLVGGRLVGPVDVEIVGVASVLDAGPDEIAYAIAPAWIELLRTGRAGAAFLPFDAHDFGRPHIVVADPKSAALRLAAHFAPQPTFDPGVAPGASVDPSATVDPTATIMPGAFIGTGAHIGAGAVVMPGAVVMHEATIGDGSRLYPGVYVGERCRVGRNCTLWPNAVIGADGFGYAMNDGRHEKIPQLGIVVLGDDVDVGAGSCVDRATVGRTVIGEGTKIDNQVQVGHNCRIGKHCILVSQVGLAGSVNVGDYSILAARAGVADNITIGSGVIVGAGAGVVRDLPDGARVAGIPAVPHLEWKRGIANLKHFKDLQDSVRDLSRRLDALDRTGTRGIKGGAPEGSDEPSPGRKGRS